MSDVFISYVAEDGATAADVAAGLEAAQITAWYYERDSVAGVYYTRQVMSVLERAPVVVIIISRSTLSSSQVDKEIIWSHEAHKAFAPLLVDLSYEEFRRRRPDWAMMLGAAVALPVPPDGPATLMPRLIRGVIQLVAASGNATRAVASDRDDSGLGTAGDRDAGISRDGAGSAATKIDGRPLRHASAASSAEGQSRDRTLPPQAAGPQHWPRFRMTLSQSSRVMTLGTVLLLLLFATVLWLRPWSDSDLGSDPDVTSTREGGDTGGADVTSSPTSTTNAAGAGETEPPRPGASSAWEGTARTGEMPGPMPTGQGGWRVLWQVSSDSLDAQGRPLDPVVADDIVLVGDGGTLLAIRAATGLSVWPGTRGIPIVPPGISPPRILSLAVSDGIVYLGSDLLYAVDLETGATKWQAGLANFPPVSVSDPISSVVAANGFIFASNGSGVFAFDAETGAPQWHEGITVGHDLAIANGMVYASWSGGIRALDAVTGDQVWDREDLGRMNTAPTVADGSVYLGADRGIVALDSSTGADRWVYSTAGPVMGTLIASNGLVHAYASSLVPDAPPGDGGRLYAVDSSGSEVWQRQTGQLGAWSWSIVDNTLLLVDGRTLIVLDAEHTGNELWRFSVDAVSASGTSIRPFAVPTSLPSVPVVINRVIYVVVGGELYAIVARYGDAPPEAELLN